MSTKSVISSAIAKSLRAHRENIAIGLVSSVASWEKYSGELAAQKSPHQFAQRETIAFVDYLATYFEEGDTAYRSLYIGEKLKQCYSEADGPNEAVARRRRITNSDRTIMLDALRAKLTPQDSELFATELDAIHAILTKPAEKVCRALLVGDCLYLDLLAFLSTPLSELGIQLLPTFVASKLPSTQHDDLRRLAGTQFDLVFYSPLTYAFHLEFSQVQFLKGAFRRSATLRALAAAAKRDIESALSLMNKLFECPIFVHNSANIRRHDRSIGEFVKTIATRPARAFTRRVVNDWLPQYIENLNAEGHTHLFLLDETTVFSTASEIALSTLFYSAALQHPARFAQALAPLYEDIIAARILLGDKKLIVCDLDNTLWRGLIGEETVEHYAERQAALLALRRKGILLAICSKNDPENVHWRDGVLCETDFVSTQINWEPKVANIRRIASHLNLKTKDFIFIDDRPDERELVMEAMPEVTVLDSESPRTWRALCSLASIMGESAEGDRTLAYMQKMERERFLSDLAPSRMLPNSLGVNSTSSHELTEARALEKLKLQVSIRFANRKELKRIAELINRTNQFNTCGSRTTPQEVAGWFDSDRHKIWVAEARDKFGSMGTVSVAVVEETLRGLEITAFVLSCRVFGYGMENSVLNRIKMSRSGLMIYGHFKETLHNKPCHRVFQENGFTWDGSHWTCKAGVSKSDPIWLTVTGT